MGEILNGLNNEQISAVTTTEGHVLVIAGAGTGKTNTLTRRYAYIAQELRVPTDNILCITFTAAAAEEMKQRIESMLGDKETGYIATFHGLCVQFLREELKAGRFKDFRILGTDEIRNKLKIICRKLDITESDYPMEEIIRDIVVRKSGMEYVPLLLDSYKLMTENEEVPRGKRKVFLGYLIEQRKSSGLDFDDLIAISLYVLKKRKATREKWQKRMRYVMVDEFQDVNGQQYELAEILSGYHHNLFVVGDPDQTIYTWRGADVNHILNFKNRYKDTKEIILNMNYRSTQHILDAADSLIRVNKNRIEKKLIAVRGEGAPVSYYHAYSSEEEVEWMAKEIQKLHEGGKNYSEIAVLCRLHSTLESYEDTFTEYEIPYTFSDGQTFYERGEVPNMIAYLKMIVYMDDESFLRVINLPRRGFGDARVRRIQNYANSHECSLYDTLKKSLNDKWIQSTKAKEFVDLIDKYHDLYVGQRPSDMLSDVLKESGYEAWIKNKKDSISLRSPKKLRADILRFEKRNKSEDAVEEYLQNVALYTGSKEEDAERDAVKMMTIHASKGLEFPCVFLPCFNEGIIPSEKAILAGQLEEERRLAYVAYTRARDVLYLSSSENTVYDGFKMPSRFISETGHVLLQRIPNIDADC
ncbi:MAG: UvrD-helicase domain-containing protein [Clostridiales bacterium]|nr:UvrD-helicase domain-containing protein [Clostridiales bacterium]